MIKHYESQDNSIITVFMLDKRISPQLLFFPRNITFFLLLFETIGNKVFCKIWH